MFFTLSAIFTSSQREKCLLQFLHRLKEKHAFCNFYIVSKRNMPSAIFTSSQRCLLQFLHRLKEKNASKVVGNEIGGGPGRWQTSAMCLDRDRGYFLSRFNIKISKRWLWVFDNKRCGLNKIFLLITCQFICALNFRSVKNDAARTRKKSTSSWSMLRIWSASPLTQGTSMHHCVIVCTSALIVKVSVADPDPGSTGSWPDPLVRGMDPDPDPSIIKKI